MGIRDTAPTARLVGLSGLIAGILALSAEAALMAALMVMAGLCAAGSAGYWILSLAGPRSWPRTPVQVRGERRWLGDDRDESRISRLAQPFLCTQADGRGEAHKQPNRVNGPAAS
jgi:hypothetical protein